jgi:hypothetical protein
MHFGSVGGKLCFELASRLMNQPRHLQFDIEDQEGSISSTLVALLQ